MGEITLQLNSPLTDEQWDTITDVDFDHTDRITFHTKHGKEVEFIKVVRCKDCKWWKTGYLWNGTERKVCVIEPCEPCRKPDEFCSSGERKGGNE